VGVFWGNWENWYYFGKIGGLDGRGMGTPSPLYQNRNPPPVRIKNRRRIAVQVHESGIVAAIKAVDGSTTEPSRSAKAAPLGVFFAGVRIQNRRVASAIAVERRRSGTV
jgi:hypothetical protein